MEYILLDTNILIYREGEKILEPDVQLLSRLLMDSMDYKLCVHPMSIESISNLSIRMNVKDKLFYLK